MNMRIGHRGSLKFGEKETIFIIEKYVMRGRCIHTMRDIDIIFLCTHTSIHLPVNNLVRPVTAISNPWYQKLLS